MYIHDLKLSTFIIWKYIFCQNCASNLIRKGNCVWFVKWSITFSATCWSSVLLFAASRAAISVLRVQRWTVVKFPSHYESWKRASSWCLWRPCGDKGSRRNANHLCQSESAVTLPRQKSIQLWTPCSSPKISCPHCFLGPEAPSPCGVFSIHDSILCFISFYWFHLFSPWCLSCDRKKIGCIEMY